jgi:hypothetical protein
MHLKHYVFFANPKTLSSLQCSEKRAGHASTLGVVSGLPHNGQKKREMEGPQPQTE